MQDHTKCSSNVWRMYHRNGTKIIDFNELFITLIPLTNNTFVLHPIKQDSINISGLSFIQYSRGSLQTTFVTVLLHCHSANICHLKLVSNATLSYEFRFNQVIIRMYDFIKMVAYIVFQVMDFMYHNQCEYI